MRRVIWRGRRWKHLGPVPAGLFEEQFRVLPAASPSRRMLSGRSSATLTVLVPMEPVLPNRTTFFICDLRFTIDALVLCDCVLET